jgi:hypothetical protein
MQLVKADRKIDSTVTTKAHQFTTKVSDKLFKLTIDKLYSDKITAVARELCCNAFDSHRKNGNISEPISVTLPSDLDPNFQVQDYGTGLGDEETLLEVYCTMFNSTKDETNEFTGCFGLGSKSPFAYTDTFSIINITDGIKYMYTAYINEDGVPEIVKLSERETDERNGVTVSIPVNPSDIHSFATKTKNVLQHFETPPLIDGIAVEKIKYDIEEENFKIQHDRSRTGGIDARMGNVVYDMRSTLSSWDLGFYRKITNSRISILLDFDIGELDVSTSREQLSFDDLTESRIRERIDLVEKYIYDTYSIDIDKFDTFWEANDFIGKPEKQYNIINSNDIDVHIRSAFDLVTNLKWNGTKISEILNRSIVPSSETESFTVRCYNVELRKSVDDTLFCNSIRYTTVKDNNDYWYRAPDHLRLRGVSKIAKPILCTDKTVNRPTIEKYLCDVFKDTFSSYSKNVSLIVVVPKFIKGEIHKLATKEMSSYINDTYMDLEFADHNTLVTDYKEVSIPIVKKDPANTERYFSSSRHSFHNKDKKVYFSTFDDDEANEEIKYYLLTKRNASFLKDGDNIFDCIEDNYYDITKSFCEINDIKYNEIAFVPERFEKAFVKLSGAEMLFSKERAEAYLEANYQFCKDNIQQVIEHDVHRKYISEAGIIGGVSVKIPKCFADDIDSKFDSIKKVNNRFVYRYTDDFIYFLATMYDISLSKTKALYTEASKMCDLKNEYIERYRIVEDSCGWIDLDDETVVEYYSKLIKNL